MVEIDPQCFCCPFARFAERILSYGEMVFIGLGAKYYCMGKTQEPALFTRFHSLRIVLPQKNYSI